MQRIHQAVLIFIYEFSASRKMEQPTVEVI